MEKVCGIDLDTMVEQGKIKPQLPKTRSCDGANADIVGTAVCEYNVTALSLLASQMSIYKHISQMVL